MIKYDIGGAECPRDADSIVIDINEIDTDTIEWPPNQLIKRDLNTTNWNEGLERADEIWLGATLRYAGIDYNNEKREPDFDKEDEANALMIPFVAARVIDICKPGAKIIIRDFLAQISLFIGGLPCSRIADIKIELHQWDAHDTGAMEDADYIATIQLRS